VKGCTNRAAFQWSVCADNNRHRPICVEHDIKLNERVMRFAFGHSREADIAKYRAKVQA